MVMSILTNLARNVKVWLILVRALEHSTIVLDEEELYCSLPAWPVCILDECLGYC